jgi:hypothetical protein
LLEGIINLGIVLQVCAQMWIRDRYFHLASPRNSRLGYVWL